MYIDCICLIFTHKDTKNISFPMLLRTFSYIELTYIANTKDAIFVVSRAVKKWSGLLGATWQKLEDEGRIIIGKNPLSQYLTSNNLGEEQYRKIINHLKK